MVEKTTFYINGARLKWAKVLPKQLHKNYDETGYEWSFDVFPEDISEFKKLGIESKLKDKGEGKFLKIRQKQYLTIAGEQKEAEPIRIVDAEGRAWDANTELGNGTIADIRVVVANYGKGKPVGIYPVAIRVLEHQAFEGNDGFPELSEEDRRRYVGSAKTDTFKQDFDLDDDLPM